jgi:hypothetical protein
LKARKTKRKIGKRRESEKPRKRLRKNQEIQVLSFSK